ncbi:MAG TPA: hypothetical protein VFU02_18465 [Polyangiaceae bacterium]|nr:hypothetical protein [Polyangiaceae bacterium]
MVYSLRLTLCLLCAPLAACGGSSTPGANSAVADPCTDVDLDVKKVWSEETKVDLRAELMGQWGGELGTEVARQRAQSVETQMDDIARDWVMLRQSACLDHFKRGLGTDAEYQARVACFDSVLQHQRSALGALARDADAGVAALDDLNRELVTCR